MLAAVIHAVLPIFGLIFLGWLAARKKWLPDTAPATLNRFVIYMALPALVLTAMSRAEVSILATGSLAASFGLGTVGAILLYLWRSRHHNIETTLRCVHSMCASYANAGFMGIPLVLFVFGPSAMTAAVVICIMTVSVLFALTIVAIEVQHSKGHQLGLALRKISMSVSRNPLVIAPLLGLCLATTGLSLPSPVMSMLDLLAGAATPCALIAIGLFLAQAPTSNHRQEVVTIVWIKLIAHPLLVAFFSLFVFEIPSQWAWVAILMAALPVGTGPFMLAMLYQQNAAISARAILISTVGSVCTISLLIAYLHYTNIV